MAQTVFNKKLDRFCRDYLVINGSPPPNAEVFAAELHNQQAVLFEHLLLFDRVALRIIGENIPAALIFSAVGERGFDALLEQRALEFVLWTPLVASLDQNIPGVDAVLIGEHTSPAHSDPEKSAALGLGWLSDKLPRGKRRRLTRRIADLYRQPKTGMAQSSWSSVRQALKDGKLRSFGFPELLEGREHLDSLTSAQKSHLVNCIDVVLEYEFLMRSEMTSFENYDLYSPFWASAQRFRQASQSLGGFTTIADLEGIPNLKAVYALNSEAFKSMPEMRQRPHARQFRSWLERTAGEDPDPDFVRAYLDTVSSRKGLFASNRATVTRTVSLAAIGMGLGSVAGGVSGGLVGGVMGPLIGEAVAAVGLGLMDSLIVERLARGWSPRMFMDDLRNLSGEGLKTRR